MQSPMADYDIFRERLAMKYPSYGHALWEPSPRNPDRPVRVGDVGFIRTGKFYRLFNALLSADDPSQVLGVPGYHKPLVPTMSDHLDERSLGRNNYCSPWVSMKPDPGYHSGPNDFQQVSFQYERTRGAAVLSLPVAGRREDTLAKDDFKRWILKHIDNWFAFARNLGLGIQQMEEIILVTGCDLTRSWTNIVFLGGQADAQVSFGVKIEGPNTAINFQFSPENAPGAVLCHGPEGPNLPENQCVFIRGFRVVRSFWRLPRRLEAAAGPSSDPGGNDYDPDMEVISIPANSQYRDPLHLLLDYIAKHATDCDMLLVHDDDLGTIEGLGRDSSVETLEPDVMTDLLRRSNIKINKVLCDLSLTDRVPNADTAVTDVKVAMLSMTSQNWTRRLSVPSVSLPRDEPGPLSMTSQKQTRRLPMPSVSLPRNEFGPLGRSYSASLYATPGRYTHPAYEGPQLSSLQPETPAGYDTVPHASGFVHQQSPRWMDSAWPSSQGSAGAWDTSASAWDTWGGSYPLFSGSHSPYNPDGPPFESQQNRLIAAAPSSQGPAGVQNARTTMAPKERKALVIGINYSQHPDRDFESRDCTADAYEMANFLRTNLGFAAHDIRVMTDEMGNPWDIPNKANILRAMQELVSDPQPGDSFFLYFSGHGVQIKDMDGDEDDGLDECICAVDYFGDDPNPTENTPGLVVDDVIHDILVRPLPQGCRLAALFDSCHSGTALDLPYVYDSNGVVKPFGHPKMLRVLREKASNAEVVSLCASMDNQRAQEVHRGGGALRCAFIYSMKKFNNALSHKELIWSVREYMEEYSIPQRPQLSISHEINTNLPFIV